MFLSLMLEYCVKETTFKKSVRQNHLAELTMEGWEAFVEQKVNVTIANIKNSYDNDYPDESIVTRKEVDESNERVFDKIRPMIVSMYRKAREISIETKSKIKFIEEEMETHLKGGVEESLPITLEE
jgi:ethanolamine ammonia-lyase large subunit